MAAVSLVVKGLDPLKRTLTKITTDFPNELKKEYTQVVFKKLKTIYNYKRDTGAIFRSIKLNRNAGIISMGGTSDTMRPASTNSPATDYTKFVEVFGSKAHRFFLQESTPKMGGAPKMTGARTQAPVRGREKAVQRANRQFKLDNDKTFKRVTR